MTTFKRLFTLLSATLICSATQAQGDKQRVTAYITTYKDLAMTEMLRTGVPASITLAQGLLETAGGQSDLASIANNHFGIKCKGEWTGEYMLHNDDARNECFRKYACVADSYKDHSDFLKSRPNYAFLFKLDPTDYEGWARGLKRAGYATNPAYAQMIIKTIVENNLQDYSLQVLQRLDNRDDLFSTTASVITEVVSPTTNAAPVAEKAPEAAKPQPAAVITLPKAEMKRNIKVSQRYPLNSVFTINEVKVLYAESGTSLLALANNYNVALKKLMEYNDLDATDILPSNQLVFLEKKAKKGLKDVHIVEENETLHDIAQSEGVQLSVIMEYNNLKKGMQPAQGERIYLKFAAPVSPKLAVANSLKTTESM